MKEWTLENSPLVCFEVAYNSIISNKSISFRLIFLTSLMTHQPFTWNEMPAKTMLLNTLICCLYGSVLAICMIAFPLTASAVQSSIQEATGMACMGYDKSRKQTETEANSDAKRNAAEYASTMIKTETEVLDAAIQKDLIRAFSNATVKLIKKLDDAWYEEQGMGTCYRVRIQAEIIPNEVVMTKLEPQTKNNPQAPLNVNIWTDQSRYIKGEDVKIYLQGNKPFFGRIVYQDAEKSLIQLLPNPHRQEYYFRGGTIYEIPSANDMFAMEVTQPFGEESITVYASTEPSGDLDVKDVGSVYLINTKADDVAMRTRGIKLVKKGHTGEKDKKQSRHAEFSENRASITTHDSN